MGNMNTHKPSKINRLLRAWPNGTVGVQSWLSKQGISKDLAKSYVKSQWLERIGKGAFIKAGDQVDWLGGVFALQKHLNFKIHVAAKTALELHGHGHFIPLGKGYLVRLFQSTEEKRSPPDWMYNYFKDEVKIQVSKRNLFGGDEMFGMVEKDFDRYKLLISSRERAIMEYFDLVPEQESFSQGVYLMESLLTLRPKVIQALLEKCNSVKVKRLFMYMAEELNLPWSDQIDLSKINFGVGNRVISKGGKFNSKYNISIPIINEG